MKCIKSMLMVLMQQHSTPETIEAWTFIQEMTSDGLNIHVPLERAWVLLQAARLE